MDIVKTLFKNIIIQKKNFLKYSLLILQSAEKNNQDV